MKVLVAEAMGMCFGVRDALAAAERVERPEEVGLLGELVHNAEVMARVTVRGVEVVSGGVPVRRRVMITAHGISDRRRAELLAAGKELIDTTCPLVRRAHAAARQLESEGRLVVVIGEAGHVEVKGLVGDLENFVVVNSRDEVRRWQAERIGVICQTTTVTEHAAEIVEAVRRENPRADVRFVDTICLPTKERQRALEELLGRVEAVVVVGGRNSNNTRKLVERCARRGVRAIWVEKAEELRAEWFEDLEIVGLTAGTSVMAETVAAVRAWLEGIRTTENTESTEARRIEIGI